MITQRVRDRVCLRKLLVAVSFVSFLSACTGAAGTPTSLETMLTPTTRRQATSAPVSSPDLTATSPILASEVLQASATAKERLHFPIVPGEPIGPVDVNTLLTLGEIRLEGGRVAWSPDGLTLAVGTRESVVLSHPTKDGDLRVLRAPDLTANPSPSFGAVAFHPSGTRLAGGFNVVVEEWDLTTFEIVWETFVASGEVTDVTYSPNGQWLAGSGRLGGAVKDATTHRTFLLIDAPEIEWAVAFSPDSSLLASAGYSIRIWDPNTGSVLREFQGAGFQLAFKPDGTILADGAGLWDPATGELLRFLEPDAGAHQISLAFSPSGEMIALGFDDGSMQFFDPESGDRLHTLAAHDGAVLGLAFSPDDRLLASTGSDGLVRIWGIPPQP